MIKGRPYQLDCVNALHNYFFTKSGNPVCALPTGTGKSVIIALFLKMVYELYAGQRVLVLTHVKELIEQDYEKFISLWPQAPAGIYSAGLNRKETGLPITFAGIASICKVLHLFGRIDLVIVDEAHLVNPDEETMYRKAIDELMLINPNLKVIGFTATPWRLGHGHITDDGIFTDVCFDLTDLESFNRLIDEGYLSPLIAKRTSTQLETAGVHMRGGEFIAKELQLAVDRDEVTRAALGEVLEQAYDRHHWLIFATGLQHAKNIRDMLDSMGISSAVVDSKMSKNERRDNIAGFKSGKYTALINNNVLTTGFDFPEIDLIVILRPTASAVLWVQMLGRGTRPVYAEGYNLDDVYERLMAIANGPKQDCLVLDFANNTKRLGPINDPVIPRKKGSKTGEAPVKECPQCETWNHTLAKNCVCCGYKFSFAVKLKENASGLDIMKGNAPVVELFKVDHLTYSEHNKHDRPPSMKVTYYCGLRVFEEYVCFEHEGFPLRKAKQWWNERVQTVNGTPPTTAMALQYSSFLQVPTHLRVHVNKKYPDILAYCYDGSAFGSQPATVARPTSQVMNKVKIALPELQPMKTEAEMMSQPMEEEWEENIPF